MSGRRDGRGSAIAAGVPALAAAVTVAAMGLEASGRSAVPRLAETVAAAGLLLAVVGGMLVATLFEPRPARLRGRALLAVAVGGFGAAVFVTLTACGGLLLQG